MDIYPLTEEVPIRVELWGDEIDSIRTFDVESQTSIKEVNSLTLCPFTDLFLEEEDIIAIEKNLNKLKKAKFDSRESEERFNSISTILIERLKLKDRAFSLDYIFPLLNNSLSTIFDYINKDFTVVVDEAKMVYDAIIQFEKEYENSFLATV